MTEINDFLAYIATERGACENTCLAYEADLKQYLEYCRLKHLLACHATYPDLRRYLYSLKKRNLKLRSMARKISVLKQFYSFLVRENRIAGNPSELLSIRIKSRRLPKCLSLDEIKMIIESVAEGSEREIRDRAMLELWYATGCRVSELAKLEADQCDFKEGIVKFFGKGNKERFVPIHNLAIEWCLKYREIRHEWLRRFSLAETSLFFLNHRGKGFTRQGIWKMLKKYVKRAGLSRRIFPHMIRHTFATHVLNGGADLRAVQELLGHKSISTTEIYTHLDIENLKIMQFKYHPRN